MHSIRFHFPIACLVLASHAHGAQKGVPAPPQEAISSLVAEALANNAELKSFEAEVEAARGQRTQAGFFKNPEISAQIGAREARDSENILQGRGTTFSFAVTQTLEFPGKGTLRKAIAAKNVEIAALGLDQFRLSLRGRVQLLAYEHLAARSLAAAAEVASARSRALGERLAAPTDTGARLQIEARLVQAGLIELDGVIRGALLEQERTRAQLNALLGRPRDFPIRIAGSLSPPTLRLKESALIAAAQNNNPLLKIRRSELERSAKEWAAARLDAAPDFSIGPFFSRDAAGEVEQNLGGSATVTVPLWDWNIGNIQSAKARQDAAEALRVKAERETGAQIASCLRALILTQQQLAGMPPGSLEGIQEAATLAGTQFRNGAIGAQLYLDAQSAHLNALRASQDAILDAWRAFLDLNLLTGGALEASGEAGRP